MLRLPAAALLFALFVFVRPRAARADLSLAEAVRLALARNERSRIAELGTTSADAAVSRSRAAFLPTISLGGSETLRPYTVEQNGRTTVRSNAASGNLTINQTILSAGAFPLYSAAKHNRESARHDELNQRRQLAFDTARAFFAVVTQQRVGLAARRRLERAEAGLADTKARADAGLVSSNDVTRSQIERASAVQSVANADGGLAASRISLEYVLDEEVSGDLQPPDNLLAPTNMDIAQLANQAIARRPDLMSARESALAASASADEPGLRFIPTLGASGQARVADQGARWRPVHRYDPDPEPRLEPLGRGCAKLRHRVPQGRGRGGRSAGEGAPEAHSGRCPRGDRRARGRA